MSSDFRLEEVSATPGVVRVRFSIPPKHTSSSDVNDGLNPASYTLAGSNEVRPVAVREVPEDETSLDVYTDARLAAGTWVLAVSPFVISAEGAALQAPDSLSFTVTAASPANGGARTDLARDVLRRHLPSSFVGPGWEALISALAAGDEMNWETARLAFDQLFKSSASGIYLDRRAAADGVERPTDLGMSDVLFRQLAVRSSNKITHQALVDLLEVYYGPDAVSAHLDTEGGEPFALEDGWSLFLEAGDEEIEVVFSVDQFQQIGSASAIEVAAAVSAECRRQGFPGHAEVFDDPELGVARVRFYSAVKGLGSKILARKGLAQNVLRLPTSVDAPVPAGTNVAVTLPEPGVVRYSLVGLATTPLLSVEVGDCVNVLASVLPADDRGTFIVTTVRTAWTGAAWEQHFEVESDIGVAQGAVALLSDEDIQFFRPTIATIHSTLGVPVLVAQAGGTGFDVQLPATTRAVNREEFLAAYLQPRQEVDVLTAVRTETGRVTVTTTDPHGLSVGSRFILDGMEPQVQAAATDAGDPATTGNPGTTDVSQHTLWSEVRSDLSLRVNHAAAAMDSGDILFAGGTDSGAPGATLSSCSRFRITGEAVLTSGSARDRTRYTYNWISTAAIGTPAVAAQTSAEHRLNGLFGQLAGKVLLTGGARQVGLSYTGRSTNKVMLYDETTNEWSLVTGGVALDARYAHVTIRVEDVNGDDVVYIIGGNFQATVQRFRSTGGGTIENVLTEADIRAESAGCALDAHRWIVAGGNSDGLGGLARNDCLAYDEIADAPIPAGPMVFARRNHAMEKVRDGVAIAIGGVGRKITTVPFPFDSPIAECELFEASTGRWRPAGRLFVPRKHPVTYRVGSKIYVTGGFDANDDPVSTTEVYNCDTGKWSLSTTGTDIFLGSTVLGGGLGIATIPQGAVAHGGTDGANNVINTARIFVQGAETITPATTINREWPVSAVTSPTVFEFEAPGGSPAITNVGTLEKVGAAAGVFAGPFIFDPVDGRAITATETTLQQEIRAGGQYRTITVADATDFPDEEGWLVFGFGTARQTPAVRYLGRSTATELALDYLFHFPAALDVGETVTLLSQRPPFVPDGPDEVGVFYATASAAGRLAAQASVEDASAAGVDLRIEVVYPGDKGLGNAGRGSTGQKHSDVVQIWGSDDQDADSAEAREG